MTNNTFTRVPKRGDIWLREIETKKDCFIKLETLAVPEIDTAKYEVLGVVYHVDKNGIDVLYKTNASKQFFNRCWWYLSGYTLDGAEHTGVISARFSTDNWAANIDKTITYSATDMEGVVAALNAAFAADSDFVKDDWEASIVDGKIRLTSSAPSWQPFAYTSAKNGFALTGSAPELKMTSQMLRKNGQIASDWAIGNMDKAIAYLRQDNVGWKPTSPVTTYKSQQPLCLPVYLGTSTAVAGDMCAYVRNIFGEGEDGWKNYLRCCEPVWNTQMGIFAEEDGKAITDMLAAMRFSSPKVTNGTFSPAVDYVKSIETRTIAKGEMNMESVKQLGRMMYGIKYGMTSSRNADILNDALQKIGGSAISNTAGWWSCCRCGSYVAWCFFGSIGVFGNYTFNGSFGVVPVLHLTWRSHS